MENQQNYLFHFTDSKETDIYETAALNVPKKQVARCPCTLA